MSISSRITEMEQHVTNAYDKLEDLGIDLTNIDKNINNIATMIEDIWDEQSKVTATNVESTTLENTKIGRMNINSKGRIEQEQLKGYNLYSGVNQTFNIMTEVHPNVIEAGSYKVSAEITSTDTDTSNCLMSFYNDSTIVGQVLLNRGSGEAEVTATNEINKIIMYASNNYANSVGDSATFKNIMIKKSSVTDTDYEPYCRRNTSTKFSVTNVLLKM